MTKKTLLLTIICSFAASCVRMPAPPSHRAVQDEFDGILKTFSRGEYSRSAGALEQFLKKPLDATLKGKAEFLMAVSAYRMEDWNQAIKFFQKAIPSYPPLSDYSQYYLSLSLQKKGDVVLSIEALDFLVRNHPSTRWKRPAEFAIPGLYFSMGNFDMALTQYKNFVSHYPGLDEYPDVLYFMSLCREMKGQSGEAARGYLDVWLTFPLSAHANEARERLDALCTDRIPAAGSTVTSPAGTPPEIPGTDARSGCPPPPSLEDLWKRTHKMVQGSQCKEGGDELKALLLRVEEEKRPDLAARISLSIGTCEYQKGAYPEAARTLAHASEIGRGETKEQALFWLGKALTPVDKSKARTVYAQLEKMSPAGDLAPNVLYKVALLDFSENDEDTGVTRLLEITRRFPKSPVASDAMWEAGWRLYSAGEYEKALGLFRLLKTSRFSTPALIHQVSYWEARALEKMGDREKAARVYGSFGGLPPGYYALLSRWRLSSMGSSVSPATGPEGAPGQPPTTGTGITKTGLVTNAEVRHSSLSSGLSPNIYYHYQRARDLNDLAMKDDAIEEISMILDDTRLDRDSLLHIAEFFREMEHYTLSQYIPRTYLQRDLEKRPREDTLDSWIAAYPLGHSILVEEYTKQYSLPPHLLYAVILEESRFRKEAVSRANAMGLMQVIPPTGSLAAKRTRLKGFSPVLLLDPEINIGLGSWYLRQLLLQFRGNLILALASYNAGPHRVLSWLKDAGTPEADEFVETIPYGETRDYVKKVLGSLEAYNVLFGRGFDIAKGITLPSGARENVDLKALGINNK